MNINQVNLQQESEMFQAYVQEMRYNHQVRENTADELRKKEMAAIEAKRYEVEHKRRQAAVDLMKVRV